MACFLSPPKKIIVPAPTTLGVGVAPWLIVAVPRGRAERKDRKPRLVFFPCIGTPSLNSVHEGTLVVSEDKVIQQTRGGGESHQDLSAAALQLELPVASLLLYSPNDLMYKYHSPSFRIWRPVSAVSNTHTS